MREGGRIVNVASIATGVNARRSSAASSALAWSSNRCERWPASEGSAAVTDIARSVGKARASAISVARNEVLKKGLAYARERGFLPPTVLSGGPAGNGQGTRDSYVQVAPANNGATEAGQVVAPRDHDS